MKFSISWLAAGLALTWLIPCPAVAATAARSNVHVFYLDDMGWAQPGCYGGKPA